jgi:hypothetical protein
MKWRATRMTIRVYSVASDGTRRKGPARKVRAAGPFVEPQTWPECRCPRHQKRPR